MRDTLDASYSMFGQAWRVLALIAALIVVPPLVCGGVHRLRHPAPLGRSTEAMLERVDRALPSGTTIDSAGRYFRALGLETEVYRAADVARALRGDTLPVGGPVLIVVQPEMAWSLGAWDGFVTLYFTPDGRLARRAAYMRARSPL